MSQFTQATGTVARPPTSAGSTRFCRNCGTGLSLQAQFCTGCGTPVQVYAAGYRAAAAPPVPSPASRPRNVTPHIWGAIICSVVALFLLPPILGGIAMFLGYQVRKEKPDLGTVLMVVAGIAAVMGMIFGVMAMSAAA